MIKLSVNSRNVTVPRGSTVAAAVIEAGESVFSISPTGTSRGPLCGMGICFECRVTINAVRHERSCITLAEDGMEVVTGE